MCWEQGGPKRCYCMHSALLRNPLGGKGYLGSADGSVLWAHCLVTPAWLQSLSLQLQASTVLSQTAAPQTTGLVVLPLGGCDWAEACQQQCGFILTKELKKGNGFSLCQRFIHICLTQTVSPRPSHHYSEPQADF